MGVERRRPVRPRDQRTERQTWHPGAELRWVDRLDERRHAGVPAPSDHEQRNRRGGVREWRWPKRRAIGSTSVALLLSASSGMGDEAGEAQVPALFGALCHNIVRSAKGTSGCFLAALRMSIGRSREAAQYGEPTRGLEPLTPAPATSLLESVLARPSASGNRACLGGFRRSGSLTLSIVYQCVSARLH